MNDLIRAFVAGGTGVFLGDVLAPHVDKIFKPDTDFARKASRVAVAGASTAAVYYALGAFGIAKS